MDIAADAVVPYDLERVFEAYRDRLPELTDYLPNIRKIEVLERKELDGGDVQLVNVWHGGGEIPRVARGFVKESMLSWTDYADWFAATYSVEWRSQAHAFSEAIESRGCNRFVATDEGTRIEIRGHVRCDASKISAVPRFLEKRVGTAVERILVGKVAENLDQVASGLNRLLASDG